jgi:integrase
MASIKYLVRGKRNPSKITVRLKIDKNNDFRKAIPVYINPVYFNNKSGKVRNLAEFADKQNIQTTLDEFQHYLLKRFNKAREIGEFINSDWLQECLDNYFNPVEKADLNYLVNYFDHYVEELKVKTNEKTGELGASKATITKYTTIKKKIEAFEKRSKKKYRLSDVNLQFRNDFLNYFLKIDKLGNNTAGRYLRFLKTVCLDAQNSGYHVSPELVKVKGFKTKVKKIYLTPEEIEKIEKTNFKDERLEAAKDWLIIGCQIGQRAGDLLQLTKKNIFKYDEYTTIELEQQKTKKQIKIPISEDVQAILDKRNGNFPLSYGRKRGSAMTIFNRYLKVICETAKINEEIDGAMVNPDTNRKESGTFKKYKLVTSHICRRSFATNNYGNIPSPYLMHITGHGSEREFLNYIGKTGDDYAKDILQYWNKPKTQGTSQNKLENEKPIKGSLRVV